MRISYTKIRAMICSKAQTLTDKEVFGSGIMAAYLTNHAQAITPKRKICVKLSWQQDKLNFIANTNGMTIQINAANPLLLDAPKRELVFLRLLGTVGHECGHILFSDFRQLHSYTTTLYSGRLYPAIPDDLTTEAEAAFEEIQQACCDGDGNEIIQKIVLESGRFLLNCMEDYYVDSRMCALFPGTIGQGILLLNDHMADTYPPINKMLEHKVSPLSIMKSLLLQYARFGSINNLGDYQGEYLDLLYECIPLIDEAVCGGIAARMTAANRILLRLWPYIKMKAAEKKPDEETNAASATDTENESNSDEKSAEWKDTDDDADEDYGPTAPLPKAIDYPTEDEEVKESAASDSIAYNEGMKKLLAVHQDEGGRIPLRKTGEIDESGAGGSITEDLDYESLGYKHAAADIARLLTETTEEKACKEYERELSAELQAEAEKIRLGNAHKGINTIVHRMSVVPQELIDQYNLVAPELLKLSHRVQKEVFPELADACLPVTRKGLVSGNALHVPGLYRDDGKVFRKTIYPQENFDLAVAVLADESGSMCYEDRITMARAASIVLYDCCAALDVPVMICGHTQDGWDDQELHIHSYAEYESVDRNDRYRIMDMMARCNNRDGAALRYICERLLSRPEQRKLLFVISDGQPYAIGYEGTEAEADMRGIKQEYARKGITFITAAIGEDKKNIQRIYGSSYLDVTDLQRLPKTLAELLLRELQ